MATNPATQPGAEAVEGDNLTAPQAALMLAIIEANPDGAIKAAGDSYEAAGYPDAESFVDELVTFLSDAAGEEDSAAEDGEEEADPDGAMEDTE